MYYLFICFHRWLCHVDDDNYLNSGALLSLLTAFPADSDIYVGKPSLDRPMRAQELLEGNKTVSCFIDIFLPTFFCHELVAKEPFPSGINQWLELYCLLIWTILSALLTYSRREKLSGELIHSCSMCDGSHLSVCVCSHAVFGAAPAVVCVCVRSAGTDKPFSSAFLIPSFPLFLCSTDLLGHRGTWVIKMKSAACQTIPLFVRKKIIIFVL